MVSAPASAQQTTGQATSLSIAAKPVPRALADLSSRTGLQILYAGTKAFQITSKPVNGTYQPAQALKVMLAGTGITWRYVGANAVTISVPGEGDASGASATVEGAIALDTIDVSGGGAQAAADLPYQTPGSSAYVSAEQIQRIPPATAGDIFKSTSGVISAGNRNGAAMDVNIRGMQGMNRVAVLVDGTQQSDSSARGYGGHNSRTFVDPDLIGGIDIEKGPSTGPLGAGAAGGVVNMRTIDAHDLVKEGNSVGVRLKAGIGTNSIEPPPINSLTPRGADENDQAFTSGNHTRSIALGVLTKHFEFTVAQSHRQNGNYFSGANGTNGKSAKMPNGYSPYLPGGEVYNTSQRSDSFLLKSKLKLNEHSLELGYIRMKNKYGEEYPDYSNSQSIFTYLVQWDLNDVNTQTYTAKYRWNPVDTELIDFKVNVWGTDLHAVYPSYFLNRTTQVYTKGMEAWNNSVFDSPIGAVELMYGGQYNFEETAARLTTTGGKSADNINGERTIAGLFSRAQIKFTDWLTARVGLRYDTYSTVGVAPSVTPEQKDSRVNPSASITLEPIKGLQFFGSYVEGWRPPSVREAVFLQPLGSTKQIVNPNLRPELAKNYEVGMNVLMKSALVDDDSLRFKASYFDNNYEGYIVRMGGQYAGLPPGSPFVFGNIDAAYFNGVEVSLSYDSKRFFADASYTYYTDVEYCVRPTGCAPKEAPNDYSALYVPPKYHGSVTLGTKWLDGALKAGARVHFAGERAIGRTDWAPYRILDVFSSYHVSENLTIDASAENILDRYYVDALLEAHLPSPGRTIRTRATLRF